MEVTGKCRMFCKLFLGVMCLWGDFHTTHSSNVVSFQHADKESFSENDSRFALRARWKRSDETESERNDHQCDGQRALVEKAVNGDKRIESKHAFQSEEKFSLAMAWAGTNDDGVLVVLTSEIVSGKPASTLWRSGDAGRNWVNISSKVGDSAFRKSDGLQRNPLNPKWIYLVSYETYMYKSEDGGVTWSRVVLGGKVQGELIYHQDQSYMDHVMIVTDDHKLLVTTNNFKTVTTVQDQWVHTAHWGSGQSNSAENMFIAFGEERSQGIFAFFISDSVTVFELKRRAVTGDTWKTVHKNVVDYGLQGDFLYASVYKGDQPDKNSERLLIVSVDSGENWNEAQLPTITSDRFFSVLDMTEGLIFMHVDNPGDTGHGTLYTSWSKGIVFSRSLARHLYPNFNSISDFYKVESMKGTYIASQLSEDNSIHSVITFDLGGEWQPLPKPQDVKCKDDAADCSLQIHNLYSLHRGVKAHPPASTQDAVGLIIVNAHAAKNLQITDPDVFISSDGGYNWRKSLDGPHSYVIADSGGLIVAVSMATETPQELKFSTDEGRCWHVYQFTNETVHHTGLLTEPGGKSMTVALWGYRVSDKKWTTVVIDFNDVVKNGCGSDDYEEWFPHETMKQEDPARKGCLLGASIKYQRLKHDSWCHNGYDFKPTKSKNVCPCGFDDFECDYGYYRPEGKQHCVEEPLFKGKEIHVCDRGHVEKVISEGYRKLPGDVCSEGRTGFRPDSRYINLTTVCQERFRVATLSPAQIKQEQETEEGGGSNALVITLVIIALVVAGVGLAYFGYKMVLLRRHKVVYRYSMLNQGEADDKDFDQEIERTLTGDTAHHHPMFADLSDEEELPADPQPSPRQNGHVQRGPPKPKGYHDDSDDDMLN